MTLKNVPAITVITDLTALGKLIDGIKARGAKLDRDIHQAGVSALAHLKDHGDVGYCNRLFLALPKGARKAAMTSWLLAYGSLVANDKQDKATKPFVFAKDKETRVEAAIADPWFDHKPDPDPNQVFDLQVMLQAVLKKAQDKANAGKQVAHIELLAQVAALLAVPEEEPAGEDEEQPSGQ